MNRITVLALVLVASSVGCYRSPDTTSGKSRHASDETLAAARRVLAPEGTSQWRDAAIIPLESVSENVLVLSENGTCWIVSWGKAKLIEAELPDPDAPGQTVLVAIDLRSGTTLKPVSATMPGEDIRDDRTLFPMRRPSR